MRKHVYTVRFIKNGEKYYCNNCRFTINYFNSLVYLAKCPRCKHTIRHDGGK